MKKTACLLLAMVFLCLGAPALAEGDGVWTFDTDNYSVDEYVGAGGDVSVPATFDGGPSEILGESLFYGNAAITGLTVPEGCNAIEAMAVYSCENLTRVSLPQSLQVIDGYAFFNCVRLTEIAVPAAVGFIGDCALSECGRLSSITFEGEVPDFGGDEVFSGIAEGATFYVPDDRVAEYAAALPEGANVLPSGKGAVTVSYLREEFDVDASSGTVTAYRGFAPIVEIPAEIDGVKVTAIGDSAFEGNRYAYRVDVPEGVTDIGTAALKDAWVLQDANLPDTLKRIGEEAFLSFHGKKIAFPSGLESVGRRAFRYSALREISLGADLQSIGEEAFSSSAWLGYVYLDALTLPEIDATAFSGCDALRDIDLNTGASKADMLSLQANVDTLGLDCRVWRMQNPDVEYPYDDLMTFDGNGLVTGYSGTMKRIRPFDSYDDVPTVGVADGAFNGNQTIEVFAACYNDAFATIGAEAFAGSAVQTVDLFDSVTSIGASAFEGSALTTVQGGEALASIGERAFAGCNLSSFVIPVNAQVAANAFEGVPVENLRLSPDATDEQVAFWSAALNAPWYAPIAREGEESAFLAMPFEATPEEFFAIDPETGYITEYTGADVDVVVPRSVDGVTVTGIAYNAFDAARDYTDTETDTNQTDWLRLRTLVLPETVTYLSDSAFAYCQQFETFVCYGPLSSTGKGTFMLCRSLRNVAFVNGLQMIDNYCFDSAGSLTNVDFGEHLDAIGERAFNFCAVESFVVNAKTVANSAFIDCPNLTELHFTDRCETVEMGAVSACPKLELVCLETADLSFVPDEGMVFGSSGDLTVRTPQDLSEEMWKNAERIASWQADMPRITYVSDVCARATDPIDVAALLSAANAAGGSEPSAPTAGADATAYLGTWYLTMIEFDGTRMNPASLGMSVTMEWNADGSAVLSAEGVEPKTFSWSLGEDGLTASDGDSPIPARLQEDGTLLLEEDGEFLIFGREAPEAPENDYASSAIVENPEGRFLGVWTLDTVLTEGMTLSAADFGMAVTLTVGPSVVEVDFMGEVESCEWHAEGSALVMADATTLHLHENGMLSLSEDDGSVMWFTYAGMYDAPPTLAANPEPETPEPEPEPSDGYADRMEIRYAMVSAEISGYAMSPAQMGGLEYSLLFHADGSCDFVMAGTALLALPWTLGTADTAAGAADAFLIDYYGTPLAAVLTEAGFDMNYFDSMLIHFEAAE